MAVSFIYHLFPVLQKSHDLIFTYSLGMRDFYRNQQENKVI